MGRPADGAVFCQALVEALPGKGLEATSAMARLGEVFTDASRAVPGAPVEPAVFGRFLAERLDDGGDALAALAKLHLADLYLACACAQGHAAAVEVLRRDLLPRARGAAAKLNRRPEFLQQVEDALVQRVLIREDDRPPRIGGYAGRGTLASWLCAVAIRIAIDLAGQGGPDAVPLEGAVDVALTKEDPDLHFIRKRYQPAFKKAFEEAFALLSAEDRNALRLSVMDKMSVDQLAVMFRVHRSTAARRLARIREELLETTRERLRVLLKLSAQETSSLMRVLRSQLQLSLSRLFTAGSRAHVGD